jgi:hypothetical protein
MPADLYDKVHSAIVNWMIGEIRNQAQLDGSAIRVYPEFAYDYYGQKGSVDILIVDSTNGATNVEIDQYEVWSAIYRLEEALRKYNEKTEVIPKFILKEDKDVKKIHTQRSFFVLLLANRILR